MFWILLRSSVSARKRILTAKLLLAAVVVCPSVFGMQPGQTAGNTPANRPKTITDGSGNVTSYTYAGGQAQSTGGNSNAGYLSQIVDPGLGTEQFGPYDYDGNLLTYTDQANTTQTYSYDPDGDLTSDAFSNPNNPAYASSSVAPSFDEFDRVTGYTTGTLTSPGSEMVGYGFTANDAYADSVTRHYTNGPSATVGYSYYDDFTRNTMTTPLSSQPFTYGHDADGNTTSVTDPSGAAGCYVWSPDGLLTQSSHVSGGTPVDTTTYSYNPLDMLSDASTVAKAGSENGNVIAEFGTNGGIGYNNLGDTMSVSSSVDGTSGASSYGYDGQSQLTSESTTFGGARANPTFSYDNAGNATGARTYDTTFTGANEDASVAYSATGAPSTVEGQTAGYDALNHLTSIGGESNTYTADGLLGSTTAGGSATYFVYDGDVPVGEVDGSGNVKSVNLSGPTGLVHRYDFNSYNGAIVNPRFYLFDTQGNTAERVDNSGNVLDTHAFDAYGKEITTPTTTSDPYAGFGAQYGYRTDSTSSLDLLGHRFYDPITARFVTRDPIGDAGGLNNYEYADNNPVNEFDPSGYYGWDEYWSDVGQFGAGEGAGFLNFGASTVIGLSGIGLFNPELAAKLSHPANMCGEDAQDGDIFGQGLLTVASFFVPGGEAADAGRGLHELGDFSQAIPGKIEGQQLLDLTEDFKAETGFDVKFNSPLAQEDGNQFVDGVVHFKLGPDEAMDKGMVYEELGHGYDEYYGLNDRSLSNLDLHANTAENIINNDLLPTTAAENASLQDLANLLRAR
jgi:RHS repeat-associated protein